MSRRTLVTTLGAAALSVAIAGPAFAGAPTYSGTITCTSQGQVWEMAAASGWTKKQIQEESRRWSEFCDKGSWDTSGLTKD